MDKTLNNKAMEDLIYLVDVVEGGEDFVPQIEFSYTNPGIKLKQENPTPWMQSRILQTQEAQGNTELYGVVNKEILAVIKDANGTKKEGAEYVRFVADGKAYYFPKGSIKLTVKEFGLDEYFNAKASFSIEADLEHIYSQDE